MVGTALAGGMHHDASLPDLEHLCEELQQVDQYGAAARDNYVPQHGLFSLAPQLPGPTLGSGSGKGGERGRAVTGAAASSSSSSPLTWAPIRVTLQVSWGLGLQGKAAVAYLLSAWELLFPQLINEKWC